MSLPFLFYSLDKIRRMRIIKAPKRGNSKMNLPAIFNWLAKRPASTSTSIIEEPSETQTTEALETAVQYTEEELTARILRELGVSEVIISNPTAIFQLKRVIKRRLMDHICFNEIKTPLIGNPSPAQTFSYEELGEIIALVRDVLNVLPNGGVEFEVYEHYNDSTYQVKRPDGQIETQQGIIAYNFVYEAVGDNVVVSAKGSELRTTKVAERLEKESEELCRSDFMRTKINRWYDPAIIKMIKRTYNAAGIEMSCEIAEGQTLYFYPYQFIAERHQTFDEMYFKYIRQNRTIIERRADNLGIVTVTLDDDDPKRWHYPPRKEYANVYKFDTCLPMSSLAYIEIDNELVAARENLSNKKKPMTEGIRRAGLYDEGDEGTKRSIENEILEGIESTTCLGEQREQIRNALREMAQKQFTHDTKPYFRELAKKVQ